MTKPSRTHKGNITNMVEPSKGRMNQLRRNMGQEVPREQPDPIEHLRKLLTEQLDLDDKTITGILSLMGGHKYSNAIALMEAFDMYDVYNWGDFMQLWKGWLSKENIKGTFPKTAESDALDHLLTKIEEEKAKRRSAIPQVPMPAPLETQDWPPQPYVGDPVDPYPNIAPLLPNEGERHLTHYTVWSTKSEDVSYSGSRSFSYTMEEK